MRFCGERRVEMERRKRRENKEISTQVYVHTKTDEYSKSIKNSFGFPENKKNCNKEKKTG